MSENRVSTKGRIVFYRMPGGTYRPAIITHVWDGDLVNVVVFTDGSHPDEIKGEHAAMVWRTSVLKGPEVGHWLWPDEVEE